MSDNPSPPAEVENMDPPEPSSETAEPSIAVPGVSELSPAQCAARLAQLFPAAFTPRDPKPLKLRIHADIAQRAPGMFTRKVLSIVLQRHTTSTAYLNALLRSPQRIDLDGNLAGEVAGEHREAAQSELQRRRELFEARRAAEREAQRTAEQAARDVARRAQVAEDALRRERQALLRAFEASTLTKSNFCALKGLAEADLDMQLEQARQESAPASIAHVHRPQPRIAQRPPPSGQRPRPSTERRPSRPMDKTRRA